LIDHSGLTWQRLGLRRNVVLTEGPLLNLDLDLDLDRLIEEAKRQKSAPDLNCKSDPKTHPAQKMLWTCTRLQRSTPLEKLSRVTSMQFKRKLKRERNEKMKQKRKKKKQTALGKHQNNPWQTSLQIKPQIL